MNAGRQPATLRTTTNFEKNICSSQEVASYRLPVIEGPVSKSAQAVT